MERQKIIEELINVFWNTQYHPDPTTKMEHSIEGRSFVRNKLENAFYNTVVGFEGELYFSQERAQALRTKDGGWFVPTSKSRNPLTNSIYFTVTYEDSESFLGIYRILQRAFPKSILYVVSIPNNGSVSSISESIYSVQIYSRESDAFEKASLSSLLSNFNKKDAEKCLDRNFQSLLIENNKLYEASFEILNTFRTVDLFILLANRYLFDVILSGNYWKGRASDIDAIKVNTECNNINFIDIKNKTRDGAGRVGHNEDHLPFWYELHSRVDASDSSLNVRTSYVLRDKNEHDKEKIWKWVPMQKFNDGVSVPGNQGRDGRVKVWTKMLSVKEHFRLLE